MRKSDQTEMLRVSNSGYIIGSKDSTWNILSYNTYTTPSLRGLKKKKGFKQLTLIFMRQTFHFRTLLQTSFVLEIRNGG